MNPLIQAGAGNALAFAASYVVLLVLLGVVLAWRVIMVRRTRLIGLGDGGDKDLTRRIRAHGNFSEYAPLLAVILIALPLLGAKEWMVHLVGVPAVTGRIMHGLGISRSGGTSLGRVGGMILTFAAMLSGAIILLTLAWR